MLSVSSTNESRAISGFTSVADVMAVATNCSSVDPQLAIRTRINLPPLPRLFAVSPSIPLAVSPIRPFGPFRSCVLLDLLFLFARLLMRHVSGCGCTSDSSGVSASSFATSALRYRRVFFLLLLFVLCLSATCPKASE
jgi:hypothetical protein